MSNITKKSKEKTVIICLDLNSHCPKQLSTFFPDFSNISFYIIK